MSDKKNGSWEYSLDNFDGANLDGVNFMMANFEEPHLSGAQQLTIEHISKVKTLFNAKLDAELINLFR